jgi:hypothetical protein
MDIDDVRVKLPEDTRNVLRRVVTGSVLIMPDKTYILKPDQIEQLDEWNLAYEVVEDYEFE